VSVELSTMKIINELEQRELVPKGEIPGQAVATSANDRDGLEVFDPVPALA
jgi:hypothetical protein